MKKHNWLVPIVVYVVLTALTALALTGCGDVYLSGSALTCTEGSAVDAYNAAQRAQPDPNIPLWTKSYLDLNFQQWRSYVRSARRDMTWGPKDLNAPAAAPGS